MAVQAEAERSHADTFAVVEFEAERHQSEILEVRITTSDADRSQMVQISKADPNSDLMTRLADLDKRHRTMDAHVDEIDKLKSNGTRASMRQHQAAQEMIVKLQNASETVEPQLSFVMAELSDHRTVTYGSFTTLLHSSRGIDRCHRKERYRQGRRHRRCVRLDTIEGTGRVMVRYFIPSSTSYQSSGTRKRSLMSSTRKLSTNSRRPTRWSKISNAAFMTKAPVRSKRRRHRGGYDPDVDSSFIVV